MTQIEYDAKLDKINVDLDAKPKLKKEITIKDVNGKSVTVKYAQINQTWGVKFNTSQSYSMNQLNRTVNRIPNSGWEVQYKLKIPKVEIQKVIKNQK